MKRALILLLAVMMLLTGCAFSSDFDPADSVIDIMTLTDYDINYYNDIYYRVHDGKEEGKPHFYAVSKLGDTKEISEFTADDIEIYTAVPDAYGWSDNGNVLKQKALFDINGKEVPMTKTLSDIMEQPELTEHDLLLMQIFKDGDEYYAYVELNVNLWSPCRLYYYDKDSKRLTEICTFDRERIVGIRIKNIQKKNPSSSA